MEIGKLAQIGRYPVKSMMGETLQKVQLTQHGVEGDRIYAFVQKQPPNESFPWMTAREARELLLFKPRFEISLTSVKVESPNGSVFKIEDAELLNYFQKKYDRELVLRLDEAGCKDSKPISLIGLPTIRAIGKETSINLMPQRFRANLYADWNSDEPFYEDQLVGKTLQIGDAEIKIAKKNTRCVVPTLDPVDARPAPRIFDAIMKNHAGCAGVYALVQKVGEIRTGDPISLLD